MRLSGDVRMRQTKRDEQIRRKLETEIGKRKNRVSAPRSAVPEAGTPGSVLGLKPLPPLTMPFDTPVIDAAQYMTAYRASCVLVLNDQSAVCGIFTAKDLALKVVARKSDVRRQLVVQDIMTPDPTYVNADSSATEALNIMVSRGFRHLPIMDSQGEICGVLDITRCFFEAMRRLERACESSQKLRDALEGVNSEFGSANAGAKLLNYVEALKEHTAGPELSTVTNSDRTVISVDVRASVIEAAQLMRQNGQTAVLVTSNSSVTGIFTTKDIVLRVLAANIDPKLCSVVRVMTPGPESAPSSMSVQAALRLMHSGHFLNLPVVNNEGEISAVVDVLQLTYSALEHLNGLGSFDSSLEGVEHEGPAWNKFWMSLETESQADSIDGFSHVYPHGFEDLDLESNVSESELAQFSIDDIELHDDDELRPEDSLSRLGIADPLPIASESVPEPAAAKLYSFKFKAPGGRAHRIQAQKDTEITFFRALIADRLSEQELETLGGEKFAISYVDDDKDVISITTEQDVQDAVEASQKAGSSRTELFLHHPEHTPSVTKPEDPGMVPMLVGSAAAVMFGFLAWRK